MAHIYNSQLDAYSLYHKQQEQKDAANATGPALPALGHALAGSTGTAISNLCIYPLDLIITRLQVQRQLRKSSSTPDDGEYKGVIDAAQKIYSREGGIEGFYSGVLQDTGKSIADSFLFFLFYNYLRQSRLQKHGSKTTTLPALDELAVGALAGACSKFFTTPIANIVTRKQTASMLAARSSTTSSSAEPTVSDIASQIRADKGIQGFWSGYSASLVLTLNPSLTFFLYEFFKRALLPRSKRDDPGARATFLMAAVSKAIASSITYPFSLAKARAQTSSKPPVDPDTAEELKSEVKSEINAGDDVSKNDVKNTGRKVKATAARSTVFATILKIYQQEGLSALYEGIWGEIFKGFFSHGITMIVKEAVHKTIIQAYFLILKLLNKAPTASEVADQVTSRAKDAYDQAGTRAAEAYGQAQTVANNAVEGARSMAGEGFEQGKVLANNATEAAKAGAEYATQQAGQLGQQAQVLANNATEAAKTGAGYASQQANQVGQKTSQLVGDNGKAERASEQAAGLLGSAKEQLGQGIEIAGKKVEVVGKGVKGK
jgi:hypothetical protein